MDRQTKLRRVQTVDSEEAAFRAVERRLDACEREIAEKLLEIAAVRAEIAEARRVREAVRRLVGE